MTSGRWRPALALGALVAGLLAMRAVGPLVAPPPSGLPVSASGPPPGAPAATRAAPLAEATATRLLLGWDEGLLRVDVDTGAARSIPLPGRRFETDRGLVQRGQAVVVVRGGVAYAATGQPGRSATRLGRAAYALASADPRWVWLVEQTGDPDRWFRVQEVTVDGVDGARAGRPTVPASRVMARGVLPLAQRPVAGAPEGLLLEVVGPGGGLAVWDPRTGRLRHRFDVGVPVPVVAASGRRVAWVEGSVLHLGDLATGRERVVAPPLGTDGFADPGAFSPDGRGLAAITRVGFATRPALALVDVVRASAVRVAGSEGALADRCAPCLAWAPAGDWVFFGRLGPGFGIGAYRLGRPCAVTVPVDVPGSLPPSFATIRPE